MPHYKDTAGKLHFLDDEKHAAMLPQDCQPITDDEAAAITNATTPAKRRAEIIGRLGQIDTNGNRPAREVAAALAAGQAAPMFAVNKLAALETEAATLRAELAALNA